MMHTYRIDTIIENAIKYQILEIRYRFQSIIQDRYHIHIKFRIVAHCFRLGVYTFDDEKPKVHFKKNYCWLFSDSMIYRIVYTEKKSLVLSLIAILISTQTIQ